MQSSSSVLQNRCSYKFREIREKNLCRSFVLNEVANLQRLTSSKRDSSKGVFLNFREISQNHFFIESFRTPSAQSLILFTVPPRLFTFSRCCQTYFWFEYFLGLTCRLVIRVISTFQPILSHNRRTLDMN